MLRRQQQQHHHNVETLRDSRAPYAITAYPPWSHVSTGVGSMAPEVLPPEIWHLIIALLDDQCFVWFVLRRVSPFLNLGHRRCVRALHPPHLQLVFRGRACKEPSVSLDLRALPTETLCVSAPTRSPVDLQPCLFLPPDTKAKVLLRLCDRVSNHDYILVPQDNAQSMQSSDRLADIFFPQSKCIRIPSLMIDVMGRTITLDWRQLCQDFWFDEFKCREKSKKLLGLGQ
ncbi:hypothetical protein GQ44DRAFT_751954 [Phaeosphaeriaceae sp. PMI808]|nr:hypothetical protein GQ44DRAFT_751954 [Phaeosphaeriaceae sp. PMI808]